MKKMIWFLLIVFMFNDLLAQNKITPPNIILILVDDLGWGELGSYGNRFNETPNLDKLAREGIKFMHAYAAAPVCSPTRGSILTGQYPARIGITDFLPENSKLFLDPAKHVTVNNPLQEVGYQTGFIGKWHLDTDFVNNPGGPDKHGFNEVIGSETKYIAGGDYFYPYDKISTLNSGEQDEYLTDRQCSDAVDFIERNRRTPFFLYLSLYSVHARLDAPMSLIDKYKRKYDLKYGKGEAEKIFGKSNYSRKANGIDNPYLAAMLERIDAGVGNIISKLKYENLDSNTIVVFFSDNGGDIRIGNNGNLRGEKTWLYEGGIRDNLIVRWPGQIEAGVVSNVPVSSIDFYPTFLKIAGASPSSGQVMDGKNLLPLLKEGIPPERDALFWHYPSEVRHWKDRMASAVRKGDFKLLQFYGTDQVELYNLEEDPAEENNLAEEMPGLTIDLLKCLENWKEEVDAKEPVIK